jgi:hypothetical protein
MIRPLTCLVVAALLAPGRAAAEQAEPAAVSAEAEPVPLAEASPAGPGDVGEVEPEQEARTLVAVLFLATGPVDPTLAENLTEVLVAAVASSGQFTIVGREQFGAALGFGGEEQTLECAEDPVCLGRIATMVGAEQVVLASLGQRAGRYLMNLSRIDVRQARALHRVFRATEDEVGALIRALREGAGELMRPPPGAARVSVNVEGAAVVIDGEALRPDPDGVIRGLDPGEHVVRVEAEGYEPVTQAFEVERGETMELAVSLARREVRPEPRPWYTRWWVWTLVGVAVAGAGAATAAALLAPGAPGPASGSLGTVTSPLGAAP